VIIAPPLEDYVVHLVHATQPTGKTAGAAISDVEEHLRFGASPRGAQAIILGAKAAALLEGRVHVSYQDIEKVVYPSLRHRLILNFQAEAENIGADHILGAVLKKVPRD
jgi:MoxR-like ATPase